MSREIPISAPSGTPQPLVFDSGSSSLSVYSDRLVVAHRALGGGGRVVLMLDSIRALDWEDAGWITRGRLAFVAEQWRDSDYDHATIVFAKKSQSIWEEARRLIQSRLDSRQPVPERRADMDIPAVMEQLKKLAELRDTGVITDADFEAQKAKLLARL